MSSQLLPLRGATRPFAAATAELTSTSHGRKPSCAESSRTHEGQAKIYFCLVYKDGKNETQANSKFKYWIHFVFIAEEAKKTYFV